jgi:peptidoglycan hydrolase FlgJ
MTASLVPASLTASPFAAGKPLTPAQQKARTAAQEFEAVFLNRMFDEMFTGTEGEGPVGGAGAGGVWRSFLTDE